MEGLVVNLVKVYALTSGPEQLCFYQLVSTFLGSSRVPAAMDVLQEIVNCHSLVDVWCAHHPDDISTFTFVQVEA
ncbi:unnamed protein product [Caretta caretta]